MSIDWQALKVDWAHRTDVEIAAGLGITRQAVTAARRRLNAPPSPAGHGGLRGGDATGRTLTLRPTNAQRRRWLELARKAGLSLREWAEAQLDSASTQAEAGGRQESNL